MTCLFQTLIASSLASLAGAADFYVSQDGDDGRDGLSAAHSWRSLTRVPTASLKPGDRVLLRAGDTFHGSLTLTASGTSTAAITVASYGDGRATVVPPPDCDAIQIFDASHLVIRDLTLIGPGVAAGTSGNGVHLRAEKTRNVGIVLRAIGCHNFPSRGINLSCATVTAGFDDVLIERAECSGSGEAGMGSWGPAQGDSYSFHRVIVIDSIFHGNRGRPAKRDNHSGNGIILGDCQDSRIERCAAWGNGDLCNSPVGGPVGIWLCESNRSVIRGCVSFHNRTGENIPDGGGFDIDGGSTGCVIENCLSWRNDGAGYLVCQYGGARPLRNNIIRDCWSIGDGRGKNNGAVFVVGDLENTLVANCTLIVDPSPTAAACWRVLGDTRQLEIRNNLHISVNDAPFYPDANSKGVTFAGNRWSSATKTVCSPHDALTTSTITAIPSVVDAAWLAQIAVTPGTQVAIDPRWAGILTAAGCDPRFPDHIGASAAKRYGPGPVSRK